MILEVSMRNSETSLQKHPDRPLKFIVRPSRASETSVRKELKRIGVTVRAFCRYSQATFWYKVDELFELQRHSQRRVLLRPKDDISFRGAHSLAFHFEEKVIFRLIKETRAVSQATIHTPEEEPTISSLMIAKFSIATWWRRLYKLVSAVFSMEI
jgi:hypothetical protein